MIISNVGNFYHDIVDYMSRKYYIYCRLYIPSVHQEQKLLRNEKGANIYVGKIQKFNMKWCFTSGKLALNVVYFLHLLLICICLLRFHQKQDELTYNVCCL